MSTNHEKPRARVFISCGQSKNSDEEATAAAVRKTLEDLGFEAWLAYQQQTLSGVKEHIFQKLDNSEYFVFVDFRREQLGRTGVYRGSLFSHQELALASYLGIDVLAFREVGVKKLDGLLSFLGGEAIEFEHKRTLPNKIAKEVRKRIRNGKWNPHWRNEIVLESKPTHTDFPSEKGLLRRFFNISALNRHRNKVATNCYVYLERATRLDPSEPIPLHHTFELQWEGFRLPYANILPGQFRRFNAFCIPFDSPTRLQFSGLFSDWPGLFPDIQSAGRYNLDYLVLSSNFPPARRSFRLTLAPVLDSTTLVPATKERK